MATSNETPKEFRIRDHKGQVIKYKQGDLVTKNGKNYRAIRDVRGYSPEHGEKVGWKEVNKNRIAKFIYDSEAPKLPQEGDEWYDNDNGILFKYITNEDGNGQWVEM